MRFRQFLICAMPCHAMQGRTWDRRISTSISNCRTTAVLFSLRILPLLCSFFYLAVDFWGECRAISILYGTMPDQSEIILKTTLNRKDLSSRCSRQWIDVSFPANAPDNFVLVFQNFYTASITLSQEYPDGAKVLVDNFRLMECAHNENDAQNWHQISSSDFKQKINLTKPLKILLYQPSSVWAKYELRNIKIVQSDDARSSSATYTEDSDSISSCILSDWKLITEASFAQSKLRDLPEISSQSGIDSRRQAKRAAARRKDRRASSAVPLSTMTSDTSASVTASSGASKY